jgi:hypothetical protein
MPLFDDNDFEIVRGDRDRVPEGMVDISSAVLVQRHFVDWLKYVAQSCPDRFPEVSRRDVSGVEFWRKHGTTGDGHFGHESELVTAASICFLHLVLQFEEESRECLLQHILLKLRDEKFDYDVCAGIIADLREALAIDSAPAREIFLMRTINRATGNRSSPASPPALELFCIFVAMLLVILIGGLDEDSRDLLLHELDDLTEQAAEESVLPYYLTEIEGSE